MWGKVAKTEMQGNIHAKHCLINSILTALIASTQDRLVSDNKALLQHPLFELSIRIMQETFYSDDLRETTKQR